MYGGIINQKNITNELWSYNTTSNGRRWQLLTAHSDDLNALPYAAAGHTAHVVRNRLLMIFGYNPYRGYLNIVQEYDIGNEKY